MDWRNTTYQASCEYPGEKLVSVTVRDGVGHVAKNGGIPGATYDFAVVDVASGDLTNDGRPDAAVVLVCHASDTSPNFINWEVQTFSNGPTPLARLVIPDKPYYKVSFAADELWIRNGKLTVGVNYQDCGACPPSAHRLLSWRDGRQLVQS